jgi:hypothetical protein
MRGDVVSSNYHSPALHVPWKGTLIPVDKGTSLYRRGFMILLLVMSSLLRVKKVGAAAR